MTTLVYGCGLFFIALAVHLAVWRIRLPRRHTKAQAMIFGCTLAAGGLGVYAGVDPFAATGVNPPAGIPEILRVCVLYVSLVLAYLITYSAIEVDSPSLVIILKIAESGDNGIESSALSAWLTDELLVDPRLADLVRDKAARLENGRYHLTPKGMLLAEIMVFYRRLLKAGKGG